MIATQSGSVSGPGVRAVSVMKRARSGRRVFADSARYHVWTSTTLRG